LVPGSNSSAFSGQYGDRLAHRDDAVDLRAAQHQERHVVAQAAGVMQQMADRRRGLAERRQLGDVLPHVVVEAQLAVGGEQQDRRRGELLRRGADVEHRLRCNRHAALQIGHAVAFGVDDLAVLDHRGGTAGRVLPRPLLHHRVDALRIGTRVRGHGNGDGKNDDQAGAHARILPMILNSTLSDRNTCVRSCR